MWSLYGSVSCFWYLPSNKDNTHTAESNSTISTLHLLHIITSGRLSRVFTVTVTITGSVLMASTHDHRWRGKDFGNDRISKCPCQVKTLCQIWLTEGLNLTMCSGKMLSSASAGFIVSPDTERFYISVGTVYFQGPRRWTNVLLQRNKTRVSRRQSASCESDR